MADLSQYLNALRSALQIGGLVPPAEQAERIFNYFRGPGSSTAPAAAPARPASTETGAAPAPAPAAPAPRRPMAPAPASSSEPMPLPPEPAAAGQPQSLLDRLRQSTAASLENPGLQSAGDIGAGMLASRSPNFFSMLGAGLQAQRAAERERTQDLRQAASTEAEARYRDATIRLKEAEDAYNRDPSNPQNILRLAQAQEASARGGYYGAVGRGGTTELRREGNMLRARQAALSELSKDLRWSTLTQEEQERRINERARVLLPSIEAAPPAPTSQQNVPTIDPAARPTR